MKKLFVLFSLSVLIGCTKIYVERGVPVTRPFLLDVPKHFEYPDVYSTFNPLSEEGVALGRKLFYDPLLSGNKRISCGSCHHQEKGFSDGLALNDIGFSGTRLKTFPHIDQFGVDGERVVLGWRRYQSRVSGPGPISGA